MKKVLLAVDDSKGSATVIERYQEVFADNHPESVVLLYVEKIEGRSLMDEMLGEAEMETLKEELKGTRYQERLDRKAKAVIEYFRASLEEKGLTGVKTLVREGHPAEEIIRAAEEEGADLIMVGSKATRRNSVLMGSVSREVANRAGMSVLVAR